LQLPTFPWPHQKVIAKNGDKVSTTEWHNIVLWRGLADVAEKYVTKGRQLYIEGKLKPVPGTIKTVNKRYTTEIVADVMQMLGNRSDNSARPKQNSAGASQSESFSI
jgi:single-strand DNA-binding protein